MENYRKGKNVEEALEKSNIPIPNLPDEFLWMQVRGGSKIRNLLSHALEEFDKTKVVIWTGFGVSVGKAITCAEIMKKEMGNNLHQITKICYRNMEEFWDPLISEMDQLVVKRKLPMIHILLSSTPIDGNEPGYQAPGIRLPYDLSRETYPQKNKPRKTPTKEFANMNMGNRGRRKPFGNRGRQNNTSLRGNTSANKQN